MRATSWEMLAAMTAAMAAPWALILGLGALRTWRRSRARRGPL